MAGAHRFPLRRQIVWSMRLFAAAASLAVGAALYYLSDQYVRERSLQAAEFNLRMMAASVETSFEYADSLLNWAAVDSTLRQYLARSEVSGSQVIAAYNAAQEKYLSSPLFKRITRFFVTNENERFLQFGPLLTASDALDRKSVRLFLKQGYGMYFSTDPLLPGNPECLALSRPIRSGSGTMHVGSVYLALSTAVITDPAAGYALTDGSSLYWQMNNRLWRIEDGRLIETENLLADASFSQSTSADNSDWQQAAWQGKVKIDGTNHLAVKVTLEGRGAALIQLLPENTFLHQRNVYIWLIFLGMALIWSLSWLVQHWLERAISRPVEALQARIAAVGTGDFTADKSIEWDNELGDIGRGINALAGDLDDMIAKRIEDEHRKQELEYRMLQNEVNPHFIYNTLNSIRWMATIQNAPGIAEMVTAFARLTKSISKGTQKLVPLQEELALLNDYFLIQQYRYGGDIEIEVANIEDEQLCRDCMIPRFTLQPLAENAIFHGIEPKGGHGSILLSIRREKPDGDVLLTMTDDGVGMTPQQAAHVLDEPAEDEERRQKFRHVGLWNVHRRIQYSFGEGYGLTLESEKDVGTAVTIRLPCSKNNSKEGENAAGAAD